MTALIENLKNEHAILDETLRTVKKLGIGSAEGREKLIASKKAFLDHLKKEDDKVYPVLRKAAENNDSLKRKLDQFTRDMDDISKNVLNFFNKYADGGSNDLEFARDFGKIFATIQNRVLKEEKFLYPEYDKVA